MALLSVAPLPVAIDAQDWYIQHASLVHDLIYATVTATRAPVGTTGANVEAHKAQQALIRHAALITQGHPPVVVTRDGKHTIAYEELADARAKVKVLTAELDQARRAPAAGSNANWLEEFEWLLHTLLQRNARVAKKRKLVSGEIQQEYDTALRALLSHAQGGPVKFLPEVLDATGKATIPYELFAASRAQARTLQERLDQLKTTSVDTADAVLVRVREVVGAWPTASEGQRTRLLHRLYTQVRKDVAGGAGGGTDT